MSNQPSPWYRFKDTFIQAAIHSPLGGGGLARAYYKQKGYSDKQINAAIKRYDANIAKKYQDAPTFQTREGHPMDYVSPENIGRGATTLLGHVLGGVDPTYALMPGRSAAQRIVGQGAVQGGSSAVKQKVEMNTGQRKKFSGKQVLEDAATGAIFQGAFEGVGKAARAAKGKIETPPEVLTDEHFAPDGLPNGNAKGVRPMDPQEIARIMNDPEAAGGAPHERRQNNRDLEVDEVLDDLPPANREFLEQRDNVVDFEQKPLIWDEQRGDYRDESELEQFARRREEAESIKKMQELRAQGPLIIDDVLTPFEKAEMDATGEHTPMDSSHEKFTGYPAENAPANDPTRMDAVKGFVKNLMQDERGSFDPFFYTRPSKAENEIEETISSLDEIIAKGGPAADRAAEYQDRLMAQVDKMREARRVQTNENKPETPHDVAKRQAIQAEDEYNNHVGWGDEIPADDHPSYAHPNSKAYKEWRAKEKELLEKKTNFSDAFTRLLKDERGQFMPEGGRDGPAFTRERPVTKQHKNFVENRVEPNGDIFLHYTAKNGDELPIKMGIEPDGTAKSRLTSSRPRLIV